MAVLDFDEVLTHSEVEQGSCASTIQVVVLEVMPEAGLDDVVVVDEVFPDDLEVL